MRVFIRYLTLVVFAWGFSSCETLPSSHSEKNERVVHVVICWLKNPKNADERMELIRTAKTFKTIPGVLDVKAGEVLPAERPAVDSSFDVAVTFYFESEKALREYESHPIHQQAVKEKLIPLSKKFVIYDFVEK